MRGAASGFGKMGTSKTAAGIPQILLKNPRSAEAALGLGAGLLAGTTGHALHRRKAKKEGLPSRGAAGDILGAGAAGVGMSLGASALAQASLRRGLVRRLAKEISEGKSTPQLKAWADRATAGPRNLVANAERAQQQVRERVTRHGAAAADIKGLHSDLALRADALRQMELEVAGGQRDVVDLIEAKMRAALQDRQVDGYMRQRLAAAAPRRNWDGPLPDVDSLADIMRPLQQRDEAFLSFMNRHVYGVKQRPHVKALAKIDDATSGTWRAPRRGAQPQDDKVLRAMLKRYAEQQRGLYGRFTPDANPRSFFPKDRPKRVTKKSWLQRQLDKREQP